MLCKHYNFVISAFSCKIKVTSYLIDLLIKRWSQYVLDGICAVSALIQKLLCWHTYILYISTSANQLFKRSIETFMQVLRLFFFIYPKSFCVDATQLFYILHVYVCRFGSIRVQRSCMVLCFHTNPTFLPVHFRSFWGIIIPKFRKFLN